MRKNKQERLQPSVVTVMDDEEVRRARRKKRLQQMKRRKKQQELLRRFFIPCVIVCVVCIALAVIGVGKLVRHSGIKSAGNVQEQVKTQAEKDAAALSDDGKIVYDIHISIAACPAPDFVVDYMASSLAYADTLIVRPVGSVSRKPPLHADLDSQTATFADTVVSENGILIDVAAGRIVAQKEGMARIDPASMTKILTVLVAAEHVTDLEDTFEITQSILNYTYKNECSYAGFEVGERVTVQDLFYGTVLPSGGDAALALAEYVAGSQEDFVEMMNEKLEALGISETTHFTNCIGLYDKDHYSTTYDIAVMLKAACDNSFCKEVLSARRYTTSATQEHPEGLELSNLFLRRIEDKDTHGEVFCAKTGFVKQAGNCAASLAGSNDGVEYICVTAHSTTSWQCIYDHVNIYQQFLN